MPNRINLLIPDYQRDWLKSKKKRFTSMSDIIRLLIDEKIKQEVNEQKKYRCGYLSSSEI